MNSKLSLALSLLLYSTISLGDEKAGLKGKVWYFYSAENIADIYISDLNTQGSGDQNICRFSKTKLHGTDFINEKNEVLASLPMIATGISMSTLNNNEVLIHFQYNAFEEAIYRCDKSSGQLSLLFEGSYPVYFPKTNTLLFFAFNENIKKWGLYSTRNFKDKEFVTADIFTSLPIVPISDDEFLYITSDSHDANIIRKYSLSTQQISEFHINNCTWPVLWRSKTQELLCFDRKKYNYFFTSLNDSNHRYLDFKQTIIPVYYSTNDDVLFFSAAKKMRFSEVNDLYAYDFNTNKKKRILENVGIGINGVVVTE